MIVAYHAASSSVKITDGVVMGAAAVVISTAGCRLKRAASPSKAVLAILIDAAAGVALRA